jgi:hypothetical protein
MRRRGGIARLCRFVRSGGGILMVAFEVGEGEE